MKIKKLANGILALVFVASILLFSDLNNRVVTKVEKKQFTENPDLMAEPGRHYKIGLTYFAPELSFEMTLNGLWKGLSELGFVKDSNLSVIAQHANGEMANLQPIHLNMDNKDVDLILVTSTPGITAALSTVKNHPIVFTLSYTPLEAGAGSSYTDHLPNITGVGSFPPVEKTMDFIREVIPETKRIGTLYNSSEINSSKVMEKARNYLAGSSVELVETTITSSSEVYQAISSLCMRKVDAVWITGDNTAMQAFQGIAKVCDENNIPLIVNDNEFIKEGATAAVGISWYQTGYHTASYIARVLNGENPANIPIENYAEELIDFDKEKAAKTGMKIPEKYMTSISQLKGKNFRFCLVQYNDSPISEFVENGLRDELSRIGFEEGNDYTLKSYNAQGDISTLNSIVETISSDKWDMIFLSSTPTAQAVSKKIKTMPVVFTNVGDPVRAALGNSFEDHLPNFTGISTMSDFEGMVKLVKETIPGVSTIGTIFTPGEINSVAYKERLETAAQKYNLKLISIPANTVTEVADAAMALSNSGINAITQIADNLTASCGSSIIKIANDKNIPYFGFLENQSEQGAVATVSRDYYYAGVEAVGLAVEVLNGKSPKDIPYRFVSRTNIKVNAEAENHFNLKIPEKYKSSNN